MFECSCIICLVVYHWFVYCSNQWTVWNIVQLHRPTYVRTYCWVRTSMWTFSSSQTMHTYLYGASHRWCISLPLFKKKYSSINRYVRYVGIIYIWFFKKILMKWFQLSSSTVSLQSRCDRPQYRTVRVEIKVEYHIPVVKSKSCCATLSREREYQWYRYLNIPN